MIDWRKSHLCTRFDNLDMQGRCLICQMNEDKLWAMGVEAIPFDVTEVYEGQRTPSVIIQSILNHPTTTKPS